MDRTIKCVFILLAFNLISHVLDACVISKVDILSRNSIELTIDEVNISCQFQITTEPHCETHTDGLLFDEVITVQNKFATLWLNNSLPNAQNITICSRIANKLPNQEYKQISYTTVKDDIPPLFHECYFTQNKRRAHLYPYDNSWIHAYSAKDTISYSCTFTESHSEKRLKWCKLDGNCSDRSIIDVSNPTTFAIANKDQGFEGTYYALLENDYGKTQSPKATWRMAFQNRDIQGVTLLHDEGDQVTMTCNIQSGIPKVDLSQVSWTQIIDNSPTLVTLGKTMTMSLDGSLVIFEASPDMNGTYTCEVRNDVLGETMLDNPTKLTVVPKNITTLRRSVKSVNVGHKDTVFTVTGGMAILQCLFRGRPEPNVFWFKADSNIPIHDDDKFELKDGNMTLYIFDVTKEDDGRYNCLAFNGVEKAEYKNIGLIVQEPPNMIENMEAQNVTESDNVTFHCKFKGDPRPTAIWLINGSVAENNDVIQISYTPIGSKLKLFDIPWNFTSSIQCIASNPHGEINAYAYVKVFTPTEIMSLSIIESTDIKGGTESKHLTCHARTDPRTNLYLEWFVNGTKISDNSRNKDVEKKEQIDNLCKFALMNNELNITCLNFINKMEVHCKASNGISSDSRLYGINLDNPYLAISKEHYFFHEGNSWLKYITFIVGSGIIILLISVIVLAISKKNHKGKKVEISQSQMSVIGNQYRPSCSDDSCTSHGVSPHLKKDLINIISSLLIPRSSLELKKCIGNGHFGRVYMAALVHGRQISEIVAVKTMKYKAEESEMVELFLKEAVLMKDFQHQHVLGIRGITFAEDATPMVVLPYMANGDLRNYILNPELNITILNLLIMGMQVACGMDYLSKRHFVHRDLAARNCMVNENGIVKIADFGMSRQLISCDYYRVENGKDPVPIRWMAPECLEAKIFTTKSDVWAYGVLLWELMTRGAVPYPDAENWQVASLIQNGCLLRQPPFCPNVVYSMMTRCWNQESSNRPTFDKLLEEMEAVISVVRPGIRRDSENYNNVFSTN